MRLMPAKLIKTKQCNPHCNILKKIHTVPFDFLLFLTPDHYKTALKGQEETKMKSLISQVKTKDELHRHATAHSSFSVVAFYSDKSARSKKAISLLEGIVKEQSQDVLVLVDVSKVSDIHPEYGVTSVPTLITLKDGHLVKKLEGLQSEQTYRVLMSNAPRKLADGTEAPPLRIVLYSTPTCHHCTTVKNHLKKKGVPFREVDISRSEGAAKELTRRTGQTGVPQTDINGTFVLGADIAKINRLIGVN